MTTKEIVIFLAGLTIGLGGGILSTKKYFKDKYEKTFKKKTEEMEEYYGRADEYARKDSEESNEETERSSGILSVEERNKMKRELHEQRLVPNRPKTDYAAMYRRNDQEPQEPEEINDEPEMTPEEEAHEDHQRNRSRPPKIISENALGDVPTYYESKTLFFYAYDQVLTDEEGEVIEEVPLFLGDSLEKYDFMDNEEKRIFVQNFELATIYEVEKLQMAYSD